MSSKKCQRTGLDSGNAGKFNAAFHRVGQWVWYILAASAFFLFMAVLQEGPMQFFHSCKKLLPIVVGFGALYIGSSLLLAQNQSKSAATSTGQACPNDDSG